MCNKISTKLSLGEIGSKCSECLTSLRFEDLERLREKVSSEDMPSVKVYLRRIQALGESHIAAVMSGEPRKFVEERDEAYRKLNRTLISLKDFRVLKDRGCWVRSFMRTHDADALENEYGQPGIEGLKRTVFDNA